MTLPHQRFEQAVRATVPELRLFPPATPAAAGFSFASAPAAAASSAAAAAPASTPAFGFGAASAPAAGAAASAPAAGGAASAPAAASAAAAAATPVSALQVGRVGGALQLGVGCLPGARPWARHAPAHPPLKLACWVGRRPRQQAFKGSRCAPMPARRLPARSRASRWTTSSTSGTPSWRGARAHS